MKNTSIDIHFNWANVILYTFFLCYGFYGAATPGHNIESSFFYQIVIQSAIVLISLIVFSIVAKSQMNKFDDCIVVSKSDLVLYSSLLLFFFIVLMDRLSFSLYSDEISYAGTSHGQSIHILTILSRYVTLPEVNFQYLVQFVSLILFFGLLLFYLVTRRMKWEYKVTAILIFLILGRVVFTLNGGNGSPHPPVQLFPYFVFSSFFGINDASFKFGQLLVYTGFVLVLYRMFLRKVSKKVSLALALCVGTIPLSLEISTVVEHSIWSYYVFAIVMVELVTSSSINYIRLISLVSIGALMRQPTLIALVPISIVLIKEKLLPGNMLANIRGLLWLSSPILLFMPFLFRSMALGTSAIESPLSSVNFLNRVVEAWQSGVVLSSVLNVISIFWLLIIPLAFLIVHKKNSAIPIAFFLFFLSLLWVFYSINPGLWGLAKYQVEIFMPFIIVGALGLVSSISKAKYTKSFSLLFLLCVTTFNLIEFNKKSHVVEPTYDNRSYIAIPYNYHDAYDFIQSKGWSSSTYSIGSTYGVMPEIMNGYTTSDFLSASSIYKQQNRDFPDIHDYAVSINNNPDIENILIGLLPNRDKLINNLTLSGWMILRKFKDSKYRTSVIMMQRGVK